MLVNTFHKLFLQGKEVGKTDFGTRLACIRKEIYEPRQNKQKEGLLDRSREPFGVRQKPFYDLSLSTRTTDVKKVVFTMTLCSALYLPIYEDSILLRASAMNIIIAFY